MNVGGVSLVTNSTGSNLAAQCLALVHHVEDFAVAQVRGVAGDGAEPRIAEDEVVGPAGGAVDGVFGVGVAGDELGSGKRGQVPAGGETDDDDAIGVDVVVGGAGADGLDGAAGVEERNRQQIAVRGEPVAEDEGAEAAGGEPVGDFAALEVAGQMDVGAAGKDDDGRAVVAPWRGPKTVSAGMSSQVVALGLRRSSGP